MISIISPAKTMNLKAPKGEETLIFSEEKAQVLDLFPNCVTGETYYRAVDLYDGMAFKALKGEEWNQEDYDFAGHKLYILSALYGAVSAVQGIRPYRLDFSKKASQLYLIWSQKVTSYLTDIDRQILNLASLEFSKVIRPYIGGSSGPGQMVDVDFFHQVDGEYKSHSTISKKARGLMARWIIKNRVDGFDQVKEFDLLGYEYIEEKSTESRFTFARKP